MVVILSAKARADLVEIGEYTARDDPIRAVTFVRELLDKCDSIAAVPSGYTLASPFEDQEIHHRVHRRYGIYYQIVQNDIEVIRVLHSARNHDALVWPP